MNQPMIIKVIFFGHEIDKYLYDLGATENPNQAKVFLNLKEAYLHLKKYKSGTFDKVELIMVERTF